MKKNNNKYPDILPPNSPKEFKKIERLDTMKTYAPKIKWGNEYEEWPIEEQLAYTQKLAYAMNHAADEMQKDRNRLLKEHELMEAKVKQANQKMLVQNDMIQAQLVKMNLEKQQLNTLIVQLQMALKEKTKIIKSFEKKDES